MKSLLFVAFISVLFLSCGGGEQQSTTTITPEQSPEQKGKTLLTDCQTYGFDFEKNIQRYLLDRNVLKSEHKNIQTLQSDLSEDCLVYSFKYRWSREEIAVGTGESIALSDTTHLEVVIKEYNENLNRIKASIQKDYQVVSLTKYGTLRYFDSRDEDYQPTEDVVIYLDFRENNHWNKVSTVYNISAGRQLTWNDLTDFTVEELGYLRNEFYARKGYAFKTDKMQQYFGAKPWYKARINSLEGLLDENQLKNVFFIKSMEEELKLKSNTQGINTISQLWKKGRVELLSKSDLKVLNVHQLSYLRNEFYARNGYIFTSQRLATYFEKQEWYKPSKKNVDALITPIEQENIELIRQLEHVH